MHFKRTELRHACVPDILFQCKERHACHSWNSNICEAMELFYGYFVRKAQTSLPARSIPTSHYEISPGMQGDRGGGVGGFRGWVPWVGSVGGFCGWVPELQCNIFHIQCSIHHPDPLTPQPEFQHSSGTKLP